MTDSLSDAALDQLFCEARSRNAWKKEVLPESTWHTLHDILRMGPTSANSCPGRFVFVTSDEGKARLLPLMSEKNAQKSGDAPAIVIIAQDMEFTEKMETLFPHDLSAKHWFKGAEEETAFRNSTLQGAYLMIAARAMGLDCGPMSGFDKDAVDKEFFAGTSWKSNFLCTLGHGIDESFPRLPRLSFDEACRIV